MLPNRFIQNSDFLSLGQTKKVSFTVNFNAVTIATYGQVVESITQSVQADKGSIINCFMRVNGGNWFIGQVYRWQRVSGQGSSYTRNVYLSKSTNNTITIKSVAQNYATNYAVTVPAITIDFQITLFKPPNIT